jgi:hypothetical protein
MRRRLIAVLTMLSLSGCFVHEYHDERGHPYRHARWHGEDVYRHEDGRWYSRRNRQWVLRSDIVIE